MDITVYINGQKQELDVPPDTPLLWVIRDYLHLTGTKFGCGMAQCGACTVLQDKNPIRSCMTPIANVKGKHIATIEGLKSSDAITQSLLHNWEALSVVQCGYCQPGQITSATALLRANPNPTDDEITRHMTGNICRCGTYGRIKEAIKQSAKQLNKAKKTARVEFIDPNTNNPQVSARKVGDPEIDAPEVNSPMGEVNNG